MNHQRQEGRQHAIDCIEAVAKMHPAMFDERGPLITVLDNLESTASRMPKEYAEGIRDVCREARK